MREIIGDYIEGIVQLTLKIGLIQLRNLNLENITMNIAIPRPTRAQREGDGWTYIGKYIDMQIKLDCKFYV
jgi:hypothetical protein